jgi:hypothetical protein
MEPQPASFFAAGLVGPADHQLSRLVERGGFGGRRGPRKGAICS